jgi:cellulose synthase/poly-beta-1,6-N-acetylglucosamine synthase-like glycosyltransferase
VPLFSVIIPTFNRAALLADALASVFAQRFGDFEVIVADDGSTDGTAEVLRGFDGRVKVVTQDNRGPGPARNRGADAANGQYLAFLDSDDLWFPWTLDVYASVVIGSPSPPVFIAGKPAVFRKATDLASQAETSIQPLTFPDYYASGEAWRWYSASSFVIRADAFRQVGGFAAVWINGEDADLAMRLGTLGGFVQVAAPATFGYRDHDGSLVSQTRRTLEGAQYALRMEQQQQYPGGPRRARERRSILTRQFRPVMLTCLREQQFGDAWRLYLSTWSWHLSLGRLRFLIGFPVQALLAAVRSQPGQGTAG